MESIFQKKLEQKKRDLIDKLISLGVYKKDKIHLFELSLEDLEEEYLKIRQARKAQ